MICRQCRAQIDVVTGDTCPNCGSAVTVKRTASARFWYGCTAIAGGIVAGWVVNGAVFGLGLSLMSQNFENCGTRYGADAIIIFAALTPLLLFLPVVRRCFERFDLNLGLFAGGLGLALYVPFLPCTFALLNTNGRCTASPLSS